MWRFFKDFLIYGFASVLGKIVAIFLMPIYTSILTKEEYGAMALIFSIGGIFDLASNLNIHSGIARDYYEEGINRNKLVSTGFFSIIGMSFFVLAISYLTRHFWACSVLGLEEKFQYAFTLYLFIFPVGSLQTYFTILTRYKKKPILVSIGSVVTLIFQIAITIYGVVILRAGIISIFIGFFISDILGVLYFGYINRANISYTFDRKLLKRALVFSIPTLPAILAGWIDSSFGQVLVGRNVSVSELGVYSIALSLSSVFTLISLAFQNVWHPFLYENYKNVNFKISIQKLFVAFAVVLIYISVLLSLFSHEIVLLLSNEGYLGACKYITLLCIPMSFYLLFPFASSGVSISRDTKYIGISYVVGSLINAVLLFILVAKLGVVAVPLSLAASRITAYTILYKVSEKKIKYSLPNYLMAILVAVILICYIVVYFELNFVVRTITAVTIILLLSTLLEIKYHIRSFLFQLYVGIMSRKIRKRSPS